MTKLRLRSIAIATATLASTSFATAWHRPTITAGSVHRQNRSVGGQSPAATASVRTSSRATFVAGDSGTSGSSRHGSFAQPAVRE